MDRGMVVFLGALLTFSSSWLGLIVFPHRQLDQERPYQKNEGDAPYPRPLQGRELAGMRVYQHNGCMYCHSQQVRSEKFGDWWDENGEHRTGADIKRSYGLRRTVPRDYIYDNPTMLGTMRTGPDLANIGVRNPSLRSIASQFQRTSSAVSCTSPRASRRFFPTSHDMSAARSKRRCRRRIG